MAFTINTTIPPTVWAIGSPYYLQLAMAADSTPAATTWTATGLPQGVTIDNTGLVSGTPEEPGVFNVVVTATDGGANSDAVTFQIGVSGRSGGFSVLGGAIEIDMEARTGFVSVPNVTPGVAENGDRGAIIFAGRGDVPLFALGVPKDGEYQNLDMVSVQLALKRYETEEVLVVSEGTFYKTGGFEAPRWLFDAEITRAAVNAALADEEDEEGTEVSLLAEIQIAFNWWPPGTDLSADPLPTPRRAVRTGQHFRIQVARDWIAEPD